VKVVVLAGGYGTRLSEETDLYPKPMVEIGGKPILWHIMKIYSHYGYNDFVILLGYKGYIIKEYFANYFLYQSDVTIDLANNRIEVHNNSSEPWKVTLLDTGRDTMTGGRILRARPYIGEEAFMLTYGDGVSDVDISKLVGFHKDHAGIVTMTAVQPAGRYGRVILNEKSNIIDFEEKPSCGGDWVNGGFFVCEPSIFNFLEDDKTVLEGSPLQKIASENELFCYQHTGEWRCMDTLRDKNTLNSMWKNGRAFWEVWK